MADKKVLTMNGEVITPVTHEDAVICSDGTKISEKYITKNEVENKVNELNAEISTIEGELDILETNVNDLQNEVNTINTNIGTMSNLETTEKTTLVGAINEVFQRGNDVKKMLVDALIAKNVSVSTSDTFSDIVAGINSIPKQPNVSSVFLSDTYTVFENVDMRYGGASCIIGDKIYIIGGTNDSGDTPTSSAYFGARMRCFSTSTLSVSTVASAQSNIGHFMSAAAVGTNMYVMGGYDDTTIKNINYIFDTTSNTWTTKKVIPNTIACAIAEAVGTNIYLIGGYDDSSTVKTNYCYDTTSNTWTAKTNMTVAKMHASSAAVDGNIYVIGGNTGSATVKTNYCYDTTSNTWTTKTARTQSVERHACVAYDGVIYSFAGSYISSSVHQPRTTCYSYNISTNAWTAIKEFPGYYRHLIAEAKDGVIYLLGGQDASEYSDGTVDFGYGYGSLSYYYII